MAAYVPNPADPTNPLGSTDASTASAEFRALKLYLQQQLAAFSPLGNPFRKNLLDNGNMVIDQRNEGVEVVIPASTAVVFQKDRWAMRSNGAASGFGGNVGIQFGGIPIIANRYQITTPGSSSTTGGFIRQVIEGPNMALLGWSSNVQGQAVTLSFIAEAKLPGQYSVCLTDNGQTARYIAPFVILASNVPQFFSITIPGPPAHFGAFGGGPGTIGMQVIFSMGTQIGADPALANTWMVGTSGQFGLSNDVNMQLTASTFDLAQAQLEVGTIASPFEYVPLGDMLRRCQRFCWKTFSQGTAPAGSLANGQGNLAVTATVAGASNLLYYVRFPVELFIPIPAANLNVAAAPSVTIFNVASIAGQAGVNLSTSIADTASSMVTTTGSIVIVTTANTANVANNFHGLHILVDTGF
jgi:hypothetical protein